MFSRCDFPPEFVLFDFGKNVSWFIYSLAADSGELLESLYSASGFPLRVGLAGKECCDGPAGFALPRPCNSTLCSPDTALCLFFIQ